LFFTSFYSAFFRTQRNKWLFAFQKSVALVLSHIMTHQTPADLLASSNRFGVTNKPSPTTSPTKQQNPDAAFWMNELGHGHGKNFYMLNKRRSSFSSKTDHEDNKMTSTNGSSCYFNKGTGEDDGDTSPKGPTESHTVSFRQTKFRPEMPMSTPSPGMSSLTNALCAAGTVGSSSCDPLQQYDTSATINRTASHNSDSSWEGGMYSRSAVDLSQMYSGESGNTRSTSSDFNAYHEGPPTLAMPRPHYDERGAPVYTHHPSLAMSPAIPIMTTSLTSSFSAVQHRPYGFSSSLPTGANAREMWAQPQPAAQKMAGSFVETRNSVLNDVELNRKLVVEEVDEYDDDDDEDEVDDIEDEDA
jgi:hypothetical protein